MSASAPSDQPLFSSAPSEQQSNEILRSYFNELFTLLRIFMALGVSALFMAMIAIAPHLPLATVNYIFVACGLVFLFAAFKLLPVLRKITRVANDLDARHKDEIAKLDKFYSK